MCYVNQQVEAQESMVTRQWNQQLPWDRKITGDRQDIGLSPDRTAVEIRSWREKRLVDMTEVELDRFFDELMVMVLYEGMVN